MVAAFLKDGKPTMMSALPRRATSSRIACGSAVDGMSRHLTRSLAPFDISWNLVECGDIIRRRQARSKEVQLRRATEGSMKRTLRWLSLPVAMLVALSMVTPVAAGGLEAYPDAQVRRAGGPQLGDEVLNLDGTNQTVGGHQARRY